MRIKLKEKRRNGIFDGDDEVIGIIDVDGKLPNLALMKISAYFKKAGERVEFVRAGREYEKIYAAVLFTRSKESCGRLVEMYGDKVEIGGTGWDVKKRLPEEIETCRPDYDLYTAADLAGRMRGIGTREHKLQKAKQIVDVGIGFTSRGCVRKCGFCFVPAKEGTFRQETPIADIINPRSNIIILNDNNLTADPYCVEKLHEIRDRGLIVDINQGCDVRLMTEEKARALSEVKHLRSLHYAWDLMEYEGQVLQGIKTLTKYVKAWRHMCFMLVGFNTTFKEDVYRYRKLEELGVRPYVMRYNETPDIRLKHFARWVNSRICKACSFDEYEPWVRAQESIEESLF